MDLVGSYQDENQKILREYNLALKQEIKYHNIKAKKYQTTVQKHSQENYSFIKSLKEKMLAMNEQIESKTELLNKTTKSLSKIQGSLKTKSEEITTSITFLITTISTLTESAKSASTKITSLADTQQFLLNQSSLLSTEITSFNSSIQSKYTTILNYHLDLLSKANAKLTTLQYIYHAHLTDVSELEAVKKENKERRKILRERIIEDQEGYDGVKIMRCGIKEMKGLSASALVLPLNEQLRVKDIADEYKDLGFEEDQKLKDACQFYKQDHFRLRTGLTTIAPTESSLFDKVILACGPIFTDDQSTSESLMRKVILGALDKMIDYDLKSILIPTFSNSVSKFPDKLFNIILDEEINYFCQENQEKMKARTIIICQRNENEYKYEIPSRPKKKKRSENINSHQEETKDFQPEEQETVNIALTEYQDLQGEVESLKEKIEELENTIYELTSKVNKKKTKIKELKEKMKSLNETPDQNTIEELEAERDKYYNKYKEYRGKYKNEAQGKEEEE